MPEDLERKARALLQLLPSAYEEAEITEENDEYQIKLNGINDTHREIDTAAHHAQTLLAPGVRASIAHADDYAEITLRKRFEE